MKLQDFKQLVVPNPFQIIVCLGVSLLIIIVAFGNVAYDALVRYSAVNSSDIQSAYQSRLVYLNSFSFVRTGVIALFWLCVAVLVYIVYLAISNALIDARNEVVIETEFVGKPSLVRMASGALVQIVLALLLFGVLIASAQVFLPGWLGLFENFLQAPATLTGIIEALGSVLGLSINLYFIWTMGQLVFATD